MQADSSGWVGVFVVVVAFLFFFLFSFPFYLDEKEVKFHTYYSTWRLTAPRGFIKANEMGPSALL